MGSSKAHYDADPASTKTDENKVTTINPRGLNIVWGNDPRYWSIPDNDNKPAELSQVSWLEVTASAGPVDAGKKYQISFKVSLKSDAFGWNSCQPYIMAKAGRRGKYKWKKITELKDKMSSTDIFDIPDNSDKFVIEVPGDIGEDDKKLYFGLYEVWSGKWKGGLHIYKAIIKPDASN